MRNDFYKHCKTLVQEKLSFCEQITDAVVWSAIDDVMHQESPELLTVREKSQIAIRIFNVLRRLDILQPLMEDALVTDVMVNGPNEIFYERNGKMEFLEERFESKERLEDVIHKIVGAVNRTVNESEPIVDARLPDGSRVNAVFEPIAVHGPVLTIRRFRQEPIRLEELIQWGTLTQEEAGFLKKQVENRKNIFVCGGTASGKTTLLNVLSDFIPENERVITIEDTAELRLGGKNVVTLETRNQNQEGRGAVTMRDLIKTSLRMRPDRIIVGEIRGAEALDMLQAMNSGHDGSLSTGHANSCRDMFSRIETMVLMGNSLPVPAIRQQIVSALDYMVYIRKNRDGKRYVEEIISVDGLLEGEIQTTTLFRNQ